MADRTVLVTGAAGFIGSTLTLHLLKRGWKVVGIDNFEPNYDVRFKRHNVSRLEGRTDLEFHEMDIVTDDLIPPIEDCDTVVHLAARAGVLPSIEDPGSYAVTNITGTIRLLEAMRKAGKDHMLFASSSSIYGDGCSVPYSEDVPDPRPVSPYGWTKLAGEDLCRVYSELHSMDIVALRFFTVYGPGQRPDMAIHKFIRAARTDGRIRMFGDGSTSRDYTFVDDIVDGIVGSLDIRAGFEVLNLGRGEPTSLKDMISTVERVTGTEFGIERMPDQPGDMRTTHADISKARRTIGYDPVGTLETGIRAEMEWFDDAMSEGLD